MIWRIMSDFIGRQTHILSLILFVRIYYFLRSLTQTLVSGYSFTQYSSLSQLVWLQKFELPESQGLHRRLPLSYSPMC